MLQCQAKAVFSCKRVNRSRVNGVSVAWFWWVVTLMGRSWLGSQFAWEEWGCDVFSVHNIASYLVVPVRLTLSCSIVLDLLLELSQLVPTLECIIWSLVSTPPRSHVCTHTHTQHIPYTTHHNKVFTIFWLSHSRHLPALSDLLHKTSWRGSQLVVKRLWFEVYTMVFYLWDGWYNSLCVVHTARDNLSHSTNDFRSILWTMIGSNLGLAPL